MTRRSLLLVLLSISARNRSTLSDTPTEARRPYGSYSRKGSSCGPRFSSSRS